MFSRFIDDDTPADVRDNFDVLVWGRLVSNACYRYSPPFVAFIARGLDVSVATLGVGLMVAELSALLSPAIGRRVDRANRVTAMIAGMALLSAGMTLASVAPNVIVFAAGVFCVGVAKVVFDTGFIVWVNDRIPYERRGRIVGVIETSWALGLFLGVASMGLVTALASWRWGMAYGAFVMAVSCALVARRLPRGDARAPVVHDHRKRLPRRGWLVVGSMFTLMGASQCLSITFGPWFEDDFGFTSAALVGVVVATGVAELFASASSSRVMDTWGKESSVRRGSVLMVLTALVMAFIAGHPVTGVPALVLFMLGFEFAVVSILPIAANIIPGASGTGLGLSVGAGTLGRAVFSAVATGLYETVGRTGPALAAAVLSLTTITLMGIYATSGASGRSPLTADRSDTRS